MRKAAPILAYILLLAAAWWFWGREPYITMNHPSDPILVYHQPKWNGWDRRGLKWVSDIPQAIKDDFPEAGGWWYVVHLTVPVKDLPPINMENTEKTMREWEKYFIWVPLSSYCYPPVLPNGRAQTTAKHSLMLTMMNAMTMPNPKNNVCPLC